MLSVGSNLLDQSDALKKVKIDYLYHSLRNPKPEVSSMINKLRIVREIDGKQYSLLKRKLPYVVCAMFNPPYRRTENFAYTEYFIIDIDHIYEKGIDMEQLRKQIHSDERVLLCFVSPGDDGLKILFRLKERCYDAGIYSLFYKKFVKDFSLKYGLEQVVDSRTSDVCRACFISVDNNAYFNPDATPVDLQSSLPHDDVSAMFELKSSLADKKKPVVNSEEKDKDPDKDTMNKIKSLLNPKLKNNAKPEPFVPAQLDAIMSELKQFATDAGVDLYEVVNIQYGKKLRFRLGLKLAEINLFYGKHGFTVVKTPRCGTSSELNELMANFVNCFVSSL